MRHDPEQLAAAYLSGELKRLARGRFERHLLECPDCWHETQTARTGRTLAESLREVAPAALRDRLRAIPEASSPPPGQPNDRWRPLLIIAATGAVVLLLITALTIRNDPAQPAPLAAAVRLYQAGPAGSSAMASPPILTIGSYKWLATSMQGLANAQVTVYTYANPEGRRILVIASPSPFPRPSGARLIDPAPSWTARIDEVDLLCADKNGISWLALAATEAETKAAGQALHLTRK